jgi:exodeoxyribonuclease-3
VKIASWNVNSIRVRLDQVLEWVEQARPDVLGLQEIKVPGDKFPADAFTSIGYKSVVNGQKTYNGVALLSRDTAGDIVTDIPAFADEQRRVLAATVGSCRVINLYVPNGQSVDSDKYHYKLNWLEALQKWLSSEIGNHSQLVVMGDFNIAPDDRDVHDPKEWAGKVLCSEPERDALEEILALGLEDSFRLFDQPEGVYSWWDYRAAGFRRNRGLRIDLLLVSAAIAKRCTRSAVDIEPRKLERPSDHAPVWIEF